MVRPRNKKPSQKRRPQRRKKRSRRRPRKKSQKPMIKTRTPKNPNLRSKTKRTMPSQPLMRRKIPKKRKLAKSQRKKRQPRNLMIRTSLPWPPSLLSKLKLKMKKRKTSRKETNLSFSRDFSNSLKLKVTSSLTQSFLDISASSFLFWSQENRNNCSHSSSPKTQLSSKIFWSTSIKSLSPRSLTNFWHSSIPTTSQKS